MKELILNEIEAITARFRYAFGIDRGNETKRPYRAFVKARKRERRDFNAWIELINSEKR